MKKNKSQILIVVAAVLALLFASKNLIAKVVIETGVKFVTGLGLRMRSFSSDFGKTFVELKDLRVLNPRNYPEPVMADFPEIYVDYKLAELLKGKVHLEEVRLELKEFVVVKNEKGELNLNALKAIQQESGSQKSEAGEKSKVPQIQIDKLGLKIGKVVYKDYTSGKTPYVKEFNVNLNETYEHITNPYVVVSLVVVKALRNTTIASLANFNVDALKSSVADALEASEVLAEKARQAATEEVNKAAKKLGALTGPAEETAKKTTQALTGTAKEVTANLKEKLKLPFGQKKKS